MRNLNLQLKLVFMILLSLSIAISKILETEKVFVSAKLWTIPTVTSLLNNSNN